MKFTNHETNSNPLSNARKFTVSLIFCVLIGVLNIGCQNTEHAASTARDVSDSEKRLEQDDPIEKELLAKEFHEIAKSLRESDNNYYGRKQLKTLQAVDSSNLSGLELVNHFVTLSWQHLRVGNIDDAITFIDKAYSLRDSNIPDYPIQFVLMSRALSNLRLAEIRNCIKQNNCDCCIFPLTGGGVHLDRQPAETAKTNLLEYLKHDPNNLHVVWILNLLSMALGEYPDGIPEVFQIPSSSFESGYDIKRFKDVAKKLGLNTFNLCGGVITDDFDGDRKLDIITSTYDPEGHLTFYRNNGNGTFVDRSSESKLDQQFGGLNCIGADYDNDGDTDVLILRGAWLGEQGEIRNSLLRNDGAGVFEDVSHEAGLAKASFPTQAASWGDFNNDGQLDLYIVNESRSASNEKTGYYPAQMFINRGDGTFEDRASSYGVTNDRFAKGVAAGDFDNDGDLDIYVSNIGPNRLYQNTGNGFFTDVANELQITEPSFRSFATWFFDYDNDGWLDLFVAAYEATPSQLTKHYLGQKHGAARPRLYKNNRNGGFVEVGKDAGLDIPCLPMGANFGDLDNDGFLDIYLTTGDPLYQTLMPNVMLRNDGNESFVDVTTSGGFGHLQKGHGVAFADLDDDGDQDIYHQLGGFFPGDKFHNVLFENPGHENGFVYLKLIGTTSNRSAVGARVRVVVVEGDVERSIFRSLGSVSSFGGSPSRLEIGVGKATEIKHIEIVWPRTRSKQVLSNVQLNSMYEVTEGEEPLSVGLHRSSW